MKMKKIGNQLMEEAEKAIDAVFSDTSVSKEETINRLEEISSDIEMKIRSLREI